MIFVFGSNLAGRHGKGAAKTARDKYGAVYGVGVGRTGNAYAIPTKGVTLKPLQLHHIGEYVEAFLEYARRHPTLTFYVTAIGTGLAGYRPEQIAPLFRAAPKNCILPKGWRYQPRLFNKHADMVPKDAVYIGRGSPYGNPFVIGIHGDREEVCDRFEREVLPKLDVSALRGRDLVCYCSPKRCHGHAIMKKANG